MHESEGPEIQDIDESLSLSDREPLTRSQLLAMKVRDEFADRLDTGDLAEVGDKIVGFFVGGYGTPGDAVECFGLNEYAFSGASAALLSGAVRIMLQSRLDPEVYTRCYTDTWSRKNSFLTRARHLGDPGYREIMDAARRSEEVRAQRREQNQPQIWAKQNPNLAEQTRLEGVEKARRKWVEEGYFDYNDQRLVDAFVSLCRTVTRTRKPKIGSPDFNRIAEIMRDEYGLDPKRRYWVSVRHHILNYHPGFDEEI